MPCSIDFSQWAIDDAGESPLYSSPSFSPSLSSLTLGSSTGILSGTPLASEIHSYYTFSFIVSDSHRSTNGETNISYKIYVMPNRAPYDNSSVPDTTIAAGLVMSSSFPSNLFVDDDGEPITYSHTVTSGLSSTWISFDSTSRTFSGTAAVNSGVGTYIVTIIANDNNVNSPAGELNFTITVTPNLPPTILSPAADPS